MCWSWQVSLATFSVCSLSVYQWFQNGFISGKDALFWMSFISMQFVETLLWWSINWHIPWLNTLGSGLGAAIILSQPLASINRIPQPENWTRFYLLAILVFIVLGGFKDLELRSRVSKRGHLLWLWLTQNPIAIATWVFFLLAPLLVNKYAISFTAGFATFVISLYFYARDGTWASIWCWLAAIFVLWGWISKFYINQ